MGLTRKQISTVAVLLIGTFVVVLNPNAALASACFYHARSFYR